MVPVSAILTSASVHDSQVAIPLARKSAQRIGWLYDVMDSAYDATPIMADCLAEGRVAIVDHNTRRNTALKAEIEAERTACRTIHMPDPDDLIYNERTAVERANGSINVAPRLSCQHSSSAAAAFVQHAAHVDSHPREFDEARFLLRLVVGVGLVENGFFGRRQCPEPPLNRDGCIDQRVARFPQTAARNVTERP